MHFLFDILIFAYLLSSQIRIDFAYIIVIQLLSRNINGNEKFSPEEVLYGGCSIFCHQ